MGSDKHLVYKSKPSLFSMGPTWGSIFIRYCHPFWKYMGNYTFGNVALFIRISVIAGVSYIVRLSSSELNSPVSIAWCLGQY